MMVTSFTTLDFCLKMYLSKAATILPVLLMNVSDEVKNLFNEVRTSEGLIVVDIQEGANSRKKNIIATHVENSPL